MRLRSKIATTTIVAMLLLLFGAAMATPLNQVLDIVEKAIQPDAMNAPPTGDIAIAL